MDLESLLERVAERLSAEFGRLHQQVMGGDRSPEAIAAMCEASEALTAIARELRLAKEDRHALV